MTVPKKAILGCLGGFHFKKAPCKGFFEGTSGNCVWRQLGAITKEKGPSFWSLFAGEMMASPSLSFPIACSHDFPKMCFPLLQGIMRGNPSDSLGTNGKGLNGGTLGARFGNTC